jgi:DNA polymerase-4/DNA polymerase V
MEDRPLMIGSFPRAILHLDADAFFASVEEALDPGLRGKAIVTGQERGIIACANYKAKAMGVGRGVPIHEARKLCPGLVILPSDYESYSLYSERMFNIIRRFTPTVEEYSIDEAFADVSGLRRVYQCTYEEIGRRMQTAIYDELGITVSVGLSLSKALSKLCSKFRKPKGFTAVPGRYIHLLLQRTPLDRIWGVGPNSVQLLEKFGLQTAYDYVMRPQPWINKFLHKPGRELWAELRGHSVWKVNPEPKATYATIMKSKTFTPATADRSLVFAKLVRNVEGAFLKARRYKLRPRALGVVLRLSDFRHDGLEAKLSRATSSTVEILPLVHTMFDRIVRNGARYRSTMIFLGNLDDDTWEQAELFENRLRIDSLRRITKTVDAINKRYGKHTVCSGACLFLDRRQQTARDALPARRARSMPGETARQRVALPRADIVV